MNHMVCHYPDRDEVIVAYLYDDIDAPERVAFETHVNTCLPCRSELAELHAVRSRLAQWATPETSSHQSSVTFSH
jgi:anti-sigma factor RsiW